MHFAATASLVFALLSAERAGIIAFIKRSSGHVHFDGSTSIIRMLYERPNPTTTSI
jgi:hypothetical protein